MQRVYWFQYCLGLHCDYQSSFVIQLKIVDVNHKAIVISKIIDNFVCVFFFIHRVLSKQNSLNWAPAQPDILMMSCPIMLWLWLQINDQKSRWSAIWACFWAKIQTFLSIGCIKCWKNYKRLPYHHQPVCITLEQSFGNKKVEIDFIDITPH